MGTESELLADTWDASSIRPVFLSGVAKCWASARQEAKNLSKKQSGIFTSLRRQT